MSPVTPRSNKGAHYPPPKRVRHVEEMPCESGGLHVLTNVRGETLCSGCLESWAALDGVVNRRPA